MDTTEIRGEISATTAAAETAGRQRRRLRPGRDNRNWTGFRKVSSFEMCLQDGRVISNASSRFASSRN